MSIRLANDSSGLEAQPVLAQLDRIRRSAVFAGSERLLAFLSFVVEETVRGGGDSLKEAVIGNAVYARDPPYDPRIDSTVRVEARRLRLKLREYYEGEGRGDPVVIDLPAGRYVPTFVPNRRSVTATRRDPQLFEQGTGARIAILPTRALSADPADQSFADGLTDELMFAFRDAQGLRITSRDLAFGYRDSPRPLAEIAVALGVDAVIHGTVRRHPGILRITVEVSDPKGFVVWSDRFDIPDEDRLLIQERVAATTVSRVRFDNSSLRAGRMRPLPTALEANARVYRARQLLDQQTPAAIARALDLFREVARGAPDYGRGHSGVADCLCDLYRLGLKDRAEAVAEARPAVRRALEVDPGSVEAHCALATIAAWLDGDAETAQAMYAKALALGGNARSNRLHGLFLTLHRRFDEAERALREARSIEPYSSHQDIVEAIHAYQGRFAPPDPKVFAHAAIPIEVLVNAALSESVTGRQRDWPAPTGPSGHAGERGPDMVHADIELAAWRGDRDRARAALDSEDPKASAFARAALAAAVGDRQQSLEAAGHSVERGEFAANWLRTDPRFDCLRDLPAFQALLDRLP
ncbi:hypothetical protein [Reyranella sp.]|uniref:hypothetical protein n=1 Tax=Reyranella sp. TaxID=1929291 RepID=UPI003D0EC1AD